MGDVNCLKCGEPWDTYHLRNDVLPEEIDGHVLVQPGSKDCYIFGKTDGKENRLIVLQCPCCEDVLERTGGVPLGGKEKADERAAAFEGFSSVLGDDLDGIEAMYEDLGLDQ
jgi:hypothetical protein